MAALAGSRAERLAHALTQAADEEARQLLLARATGNTDGERAMTGGNGLVQLTAKDFKSDQEVR